jgi:competence protein ComGC
MKMPSAAVCSALRVPHSAFAAAFTRAELLVILTVLTLLAFVVLPALASTRPRSHRVICANNLRQIGVGFQLWGQDHDDTLPQETAMLQGGTRTHPLAANVWLHFAWISNELTSPKSLLCPSDSGRPAGNFSGDPTNGYVHPNFANRATTYFLGYRAAAFYHHPDAPIAGDRNVSNTGISGCPQFNLGLIIPLFALPGTTRWTEGLHEPNGNVLIWDGRVTQATSENLQKLFTVDRDNGVKHIITPR